MMAYKDGFVVSIVKDNQNLRTINKNNKRTAIIPFGSEYKIRLINKNSVRCKAAVFIDGTDVLFGKKVILNPYETFDLERFVDSLDSGKKFKFESVKRAMASGEIGDPDSPDNGCIKVDFYKEYQEINIPFNNISGTLNINSSGNIGLGVSNSTTHIDLQNLNLTNTAYTGTGLSTPTSGKMFTRSLNSANSYSVMDSNSVMDSTCVSSSFTNSTPTSGVEFCVASAGIPDTPLNIATKGVTVEGSASSQNFSLGTNFVTNAFATTIQVWLQAPEVPKQTNNYSDILYQKYILPALNPNASEAEKLARDAIMPVYLEAKKLELSK